MKTLLKLPALALLACFTLNYQLSTVFAQGTAFTYQGRLNDGGSPAHGSYDLTFSLFNVSSGGSAVAGPSTQAGVGITNGLFTVTLDFGSVFNGTTYWLQIAARTNGAATFITLSPRQQLTPTPYAIYGETSGLANTVANGTISSLQLNTLAPPTSGQVLEYNGSSLAWTTPGTALSAWGLSGNSGTSAGANFVGTTDNQPLEFRVNNLVGFRLEPGGSNSVNVIGGWAGNGVTAGAAGATIGGGGAGNYFGLVWSNQVGSDFGTVSGGTVNTIQNGARYATIGGGWNNTIQSNAYSAIVCGGEYNTIQDGAYESSIVGGYLNVVEAGATGDTINGGSYNQMETAVQNAVIGGGYGNLIQSNSWNATIAGGDGNVIQTNDSYSTISGGGGNSIQSTASSATIGGGLNNMILSNGVFTIIGGGFDNVIQNDAVESAIAGGRQNMIRTNAPDSFIGGGLLNAIQPYGGGSVISGGYRNLIQPDTSLINGEFATLSGGLSNVVAASGGTVAGGCNNIASGSYAMVPGGSANTAGGAYSFAAGDGAISQYQGDFVWADSSGGAYYSTATNQFAVRAAGGILFAGDLQLSGGAASYHNFSLSGGNALGYLYGSFPALADGIHLGYNYYYDTQGNGHISNTSFGTSRLTLGFGFIGLYVGGVNGAPSTERLYADSTGVRVDGTFNNNSDRNAKENFVPVSAAHILEKVSSLPISEWSYKSDAATRHIGPMAQDFYSAFNVGTDEKHIAPIDEGGVAFAAIQGLNQKVEELKADLNDREAENAELKQRLEKLEQIILKQK
jgi:trimeric autotransporter adhesin